jgi:hypothetical protein
MRDRLRRAEQQAAELGGVAYIPQIDGPPVRVSNEEMREAFSVSVKRLCGQNVPEHPVSRAAANSPDPDWHNNFIAFRSSVTGREVPEDLSE